MTTFEKLEELIYKGFKETDERIEKLRQDAEAHRKATDKCIERIHQQFGKELNGVTESLSRFSEQMVFPAAQRLFSKRGIQLDPFYANFEGRLKGEKMETDVIGLGSDCAVLIEVKLRLRQDDIEDFLKEKLPRFFDFFPHFRRPILYGGVAGMSIDKGVDRFAYKRGLFVIAQTGENLRILNDTNSSRALLQKPKTIASPRAKRRGHSAKLCYAPRALRSAHSYLNALIGFPTAALID